MTPDLSIVIVHYETPAELLTCLRSLADSVRAPQTEVFVVDNASSNFPRSEVEGIVPLVSVIQNDTNVGFARAANQALRHAQGRYLLLLNPDTIVAPDTLAAMVAYMDGHADVGCATPRLVLPDGRLDLACRRSFPTLSRAFFRLTWISRLLPNSRRFAQYNLTYLDESRETEIDSPCGAFMIVRREAQEAVGLLDERYFMYGEDLDWAFRIKQAGWRVMYAPVTTVEHVKRASSRRSRPRTIRAFHDAMRIFYRSHYENRYPRPVAWLTYTAITLREGLELMSARIRNRDAAT